MGPNFPLSTNQFWLAAVFLIFLGLSHLLLLRVFPLTKKGWKRVDYLWLSMTFFGLLGSAGLARQSLAENSLVGAESRLEATRVAIADRIQFGLSGAVCRRFTPGQLSPPAAEIRRIQLEYDALCSWFQNANAALIIAGSTDTAVVLDRLKDSIPRNLQDSYPIDSLYKAADIHNTTLRERNALAAASQASTVEELGRLVGPFLVAGALALRLTKVSAEIEEEKKA